MRILVLFCLAAACLPAAAGDDALPSEANVRRRGLAALPAVLRHVEAADPDRRLRARRLARLIALARWELCPAGMRVLVGQVVVDRRGVRSRDGLFLGTREVTLGEFRPFARDHLKGADRWNAGDPGLPVTNVSLREARAFAKRRGARLPTAAEWDLAARGGGRDFPWGSRLEPARANTRDSGRGRLLPAGSLAAGASRDGVLDLVGNAAEWTTTPAGRDQFAVVGGSYRTRLRAVRVRALETYRLAETARLADVGFRLARSLPPIALE